MSEELVILCEQLARADDTISELRAKLEDAKKNPIRLDDYDGMCNIFCCAHKHALSCRKNLSGE